MFTTLKVKTQTLGEYLRECRQRLNFTEIDVAKFANVQPKYLRFLEEGRFRDLPAEVYVKGFLRSLANIYHVDAEDLLRQYAHEQEISKNLEFESKITMTRFSAPKFIFSPKTLTIGGLVLLGLMSLTYLYFQVSSLGRPPKLEIVSPVSDTQVASGALTVEGKTEAGASVYLNNQAVAVDANGVFRENLTLGSGTNILTIKSVNKFGKQTVLTRTILYQEKEIAGVATGTPEIVSFGDLLLEIMIESGAAWISVEADGVEKFAGTMLQGSQKLVSATEKLVLTTGNAGSTRVKLNGKDLGILGKEGEVIRDIEFTR